MSNGRTAVSVSVSISIRPDILKRARRQAKRINRTLSNYIVTLIERDLEQNKEATK